MKKTQRVHFTLKGTVVLHEVPIGYNNNFISNSTSTKFLGVIIENTLSWKAQSDHLLPKLCMACYIVLGQTFCVSRKSVFIPWWPME
jgi:hypothetical protein